MKKYKARLGAPFPKDRAQEVGCEVERIKRDRKKLKPEFLVEEAQSKHSKLHDLFDWDDGIAAEKWRVQQARNIINHIVEVIIVDEEPQEVRSFFSVDNSEGKKYVSLKDIAKNSQYRAQLIDRANAYLGNLMGVLKILKGEL